jgi:glycosyltransferase involved in cell wall biosynthesis
MRLGIIARSDNTGLGNQTRELVNMLNPNKILLIDSTKFNKNKQHPEWYQGHDIIMTNFGFPKRGEIKQFLDGLDIVFSCETFYSSMFVDMARNLKIKTVLQYNYEFLVNVQNKEESLPDVFVAPSVWQIETMIKMFGDEVKIIHLPPPTSVDLFKIPRDENLSRFHSRLLHVGGKQAARDRNGTNTVFEMLKYSKEDYELVVTSQTEFENEVLDSRVVLLKQNIKNRENLYFGFDGMILPRRYAGLCLPMNEALMSAMPVFMTDLSPNNKILPERWLVPATQTGQFKAKSIINVYSANPKHLAELVDNYMRMTRKKQLKMKNQAFEIANSTFSVEVLKDKYLNLFESLM